MVAATFQCVLLVLFCVYEVQANQDFRQTQHLITNRNEKLFSTSAFNLYSNLVRDHLCSVMFILKKSNCGESTYAQFYNLVEPFIDYSFLQFRDIVTLESEHNFDNLTSPFGTGATRFGHCFLTWSSVPTATDVSNVITWFQSGRKRAKYLKFPRLDSDYFVFDVRQSVLIQSTLPNIQKIKFGLTLQSMNGATSVKTICGYCSRKTRLIRQEKPYKFQDHSKNFNKEVIRFSLPTMFSIRVGLELRSDGTYVPEEDGYGGLALLLAEKLNFTAEFYQSSDNGGTGLKLKNKAWTGATGDLIYGKADVVVALIISGSRYPMLSYSWPLESLTMTFTTAKPRRYFNWRSVIQPFHWTTYCTLAIVMVALALILTVNSYVKDCRERRIKLKIYFRLKSCKAVLVRQNVQRLNSDFKKACTFLIASVLAQSFKIKKNARILTSMWLLAVIVLSTAYQSKIFFFMTFPLHDHVPATLNELADSDYSLTLWSGGGSSYSYFQKATFPAYRKIFARMTQERNMKKCILGSLAPKSACITYTEMANFAIQTDMSDRFGQTPINLATARTFPFYLGIAMQKHSIMQEAFNAVLLPMVETRIFDRLNKIFAYKQKQKIEEQGGRGKIQQPCGGLEDKCEDQPLLGNFVGIFYFLLGGWVIAVLGIMAETLPSYLQWLKLFVRFRRKKNDSIDLQQDTFHF